MPRTKGIGGHQRAYRGRTDSWITPQPILDALGPFDLDPCACDPQPWSTADRMLTEAHDGLSRTWRGRVWLNPPYGPATWTWLQRLSEHGDGIALTFARTETAGFHRWVWRKSHGLFFLKGRLHFHRPSGKRAAHNAGGPSVLIAYGSQNARVLQDCGLSGIYVPGRVK